MRKPAFAPPLPIWRTRKKKSHLHVICDLYKMKQFYRLLCVAKNCDWSRKITPLSNLTKGPLLYRGMKVAHFRSNMHKTVEVRQLKNFNEAEFLRDLRMIDWNRVTTHNNPNELWDVWKHLLASVIDKHALLRTKRVKNKRSPWITNERLREIRTRDFLKRKTASTNDLSFDLETV